LSHTHLFACIAALFFAACANVVTPQGGAKDTTPPRVDSARSTLFGLTNYKAKQITLTFDEWVALDNPQQILISPPLNKRAEVTLKNKSVVVRWTDTLRENTTYSINFGNAVKDFTEGNAAQNLRMAFSTGDVLDTLRLRGNVVDALTGAATKEAFVQLYDTFSDSVVRKKLPNYFAVTDETGSFSIENIKAGTYKIIALKDVNSNYKYDQDGESIAFDDEKITIPTTKNPVLEIYDPEKPLKVQQAKSNSFGRTDLVFTRKPTDAKLRFLESGTIFKTSIRADTLTIWHNLEGKQTVLVEQAKQAKPDTVRFTAAAKTAPKAKIKPFVSAGGKGSRRGSVQNTNKTAPINNTVEIKTAQVLTSDTLTIDFDRPLATIDATQIVLLDSSKKDVSLDATLDATKIGILRISTKFKDNQNYILKILPNALKDDYNTTNDTIIYTSIKRLAQKEMGTVILKIEKLDNTKAYILELNDANQNIIKTFYISNKTDFKTTVPNLQVTNYGFRLITDDNNNKKYDTGNYYEHRQPENIVTVAPQTLRANWELELTNTSNKTKIDKK
jgi:Bacterial Ig-like domain